MLDTNTLFFFLIALTSIALVSNNHAIALVIALSSFVALFFLELN